MAPHVFDGQIFHLTFCFVGSEQSDPENPAVLDPALEVTGDASHAPFFGDEFTPYRDLSPAARRDFLNWNAGGRQSAHVPRAFLLLFVSALEHAIFRDCRREELQAIRDELGRLIELHQRDPVFCTIARRLALACALIDPEFVPDPIPSSPDANYRSEMPMNVRLFLGWMYRAAGRLEADAALLFVLQQPQTRLEPSVANHFREIRELWCLQYPHVVTDSLADLARTSRLAMKYEPINGSFDCTCQSSLPDVGFLPVPEQLSELYRVCKEAVANLRSEPGQLLPNVPVLAASLRYESDAELVLKSDATTRLLAMVPGTSPTPIRVGELLDTLLDSPPLKPTKIISKKLSKHITEFLDEQGFGFEPDPRSKLPTLFRPDAGVAMFRHDGMPFEGPVDAYLLAQAAIIASSLGHCWFPSLQPLDVRCIEERLPYRYRFSDREFLRLEATRLAVVSAEEKRNFLVRWIKILWRERRLDDLVRGFGIAFKGQCRNSQLPKLARAISIACPGAIDADVLLGAAAAKPLPDPYENLDGRAQALVDAEFTTPIAHNSQQTKQVEAPSSAAIEIEGLDLRYAGLLLALFERARTQAEFEELSRSRRLSPAGAIDRINEWALLQLGFAAIVEGDDFTLSFEAAEYLSSRIVQQ